MDSIDITDSAFTLGAYSVSDAVTNNMQDNTIYMYIGAAIVIAFICMFTYKFYMNTNSKRENENMDCAGGFCTMNSSHEQPN